MLMMLIPLTVAAGIIYLIFRAVAKGSNSYGPGGEARDPLIILKVRTRRAKYPGMSTDESGKT